MTLESLHTEWATDSELDLSQPDKELRKVPFLHSKWWKYYTDERQRYILIKQDYDTLRHAKFEWLLGRMDDTERERRGWPYQHIRLVRQEVDQYLDSDTELLPLQAKIDIQELKLKFIEDVIKSVNNRGYKIKTYVDYLKFSNGVG